MAMIGWLVFCVIAAGLGLFGGYFLLIALYLGDKSCLLATAVLWILSAVVGYAAWANMPFHVVMQVTS